MTHTDTDAWLAFFVVVFALVVLLVLMNQRR